MTIPFKIRSFIVRHSFIHRLNRTDTFFTVVTPSNVLSLSSSQTVKKYSKTVPKRSKTLLNGPKRFQNGQNPCKMVLKRSSIGNGVIKVKDKSNKSSGTVKPNVERWVHECPTMNLRMLNDERTNLERMSDDEWTNVRRWMNECPTMNERMLNECPTICEWTNEWTNLERYDHHTVTVT